MKNHDNEWTSTKPTEPGWFWCKQLFEKDGNKAMWVGIVRVENVILANILRDGDDDLEILDESPTMLVTILSAPTKSVSFKLAEFEAEWVGPLIPPAFDGAYYVRIPHE